jgi:hypothetical protein
MHPVATLLAFASLALARAQYPPSLQPARAAATSAAAAPSLLPADAAPLGSAPRNMAVRAMFRFAVEDAASQREERTAMHDSVANIIKHALQTEQAPAPTNSWIHGFFSPLDTLPPLPLEAPAPGRRRPGAT